MTPIPPRLSHRRSIRLKGYNYALPGAYFVTLCTYRRAPLFGQIREGQISLNALGTLVQESWLSIAKKRSNAILDEFVVMPNHLHGIIIIDDERCSDRASAKSESASMKSGKLSPDSLGAIVGQFKGEVTKQAKALSVMPASQIWQRNFYDRIIRNQNSLDEIRAYIRDNPSRWHEDSLFV